MTACVRSFNSKANCCTPSPVERDIKMSTCASFHGSSVKAQARRDGNPRLMTQADGRGH